MAKKHRSTRAISTRLAHLPRQAELVIEGGKAPVAIWIHEGGEVVRPQVSLWLEADTGHIRSTRLIGSVGSKDGGVREALDALLEALVNPLPQPFDLEEAEPALPAKVLINDADLAEAARELLDPLGVRVEFDDDLPDVEDAIEDLAESLGADPEAEPPEPFSWDIDPAVLPALYHAAMDYAAAAPWRFLPDMPPIAVNLGEHGPAPGIETVYACVLGDAEMVRGLALYFSFEDIARLVELGEELDVDEDEVEGTIELLRQAGAPVDDAPPDELREMVEDMLMFEHVLEERGVEQIGDALTCFLERKAENDPTYLEWLNQHRLNKYARGKLIPAFVRTERGESPRMPQAREAQSLTLALAAVRQFAQRYQRQLSQGAPPPERLTMQARVPFGAEQIYIDVTYPPSQYVLQDTYFMDV